jgi:hypothetical protein
VEASVDGNLGHVDGGGEVGHIGKRPARRAAGAGNARNLSKISDLVSW